ncbi:class I SAM-dependent methyltransferase [Desulfobulbus rhabdoformis]|uniref:class I SAM-dependent methyltransferase n=1 Tax=Desulfobulbus rhabdoformis TaxID=34032 RepID=UPI0019662E17|nr:class I SAM-dependent methyltransferase [Desulfobulbus rhabdoformis]MBM9615530.1 class I SAM-dependent methyltransferase [Desulfobulbus rhabdoformis]
MHPENIPLYNEVALGVHAPIYSYYARRIVEETSITTGHCLDIGCGGGYLGLALAQITALDFVFCDQSGEMLACAQENIAHFHCATRAKIVHGSVQQIPLEDQSMDLVISRGSLPFWEDLPTAFTEIYRVLRPGGQAYIGGGLGDPNTREAMKRLRRQTYPDWQEKQRPPHHSDQQYQEGLTRAGIHPFLVTRNDEGLWIRFRKEIQ